MTRSRPWRQAPRGEDMFIPSPGARPTCSGLFLSMVPRMGVTDEKICGPFDSSNIRPPPVTLSLRYGYNIGAGPAAGSSSGSASACGPGGFASPSGTDSAGRGASVCISFGPGF